MFILYAYDGENWLSFADFKDKKNYAERVNGAAEIKEKTAKTEAEKNAAIVMREFVLAKKYFAEKYGKTVRRALRHFDEVGLSNDICASLEELLDEGYEAFALAKDGEDVSAFELSELNVTI
ncbi:MAG: hypothetical protein IJV80_02215 [Clostridia bacterium]|nr:hypothetical protein [Clostridia bacterium]